MRPGCGRRRASQWPESVNQSRPSAPKQRSFGPSSGMPATSVQIVSIRPSGAIRWIDGGRGSGAVQAPIAGPWVT